MSDIPRPVCTLPATSPDRELLVRLAAGPASGDLLARDAGQTRAAVWKRIQGLRRAGVAIDAAPGHGYCLRSPLDLLEPAAILAGLDAQVAARLAALEVAWSLDSTNSELLRRDPPARGCAVLLAERQTGGRGRYGRSWASPLAAHVYLSLARGFRGGLARLGGLSLVVGIACGEALRGLGFPQVGVKWPNDLVVADGDGLRKLGGVLVEGRGELAGNARAVIGVGLNVHMPEAAAATIDQPWIDLAGLAGPTMPPSRNRIVAALLAQLVPALEQFDEHGLAPFLPRYAALDVLAGRGVRVLANEAAWPATALGIAADGALRVRDAGGHERCVHAGDVSVRA